jgi:hypothetical protein
VLGGHLSDTRHTWLTQQLCVFAAPNAHEIMGSSSSKGWGQRRYLEQQQYQQVLTIAPEPVCWPTGLGFAALAGLCPNSVWAAAVADPFQRWELAAGSNGSGARLAASAWQQQWQQYSSSEQEWQQQVLELRRQLRQQQQQQVVEGAPDHDDKQQQQQYVPRCPALGPMRVLHEQQHSASQQQLLLLPPSRAALAGGRARRQRRLLLLVDDIAAGHDTAAGNSGSSGRPGLRRERAVWSDEDRQLLAAIQQQQQQQQAEDACPRELGELLPPLVLSAARRLRHLAPLLRAAWGAVIPRALSPPVTVSCSSSGWAAQQQAVQSAPW